MILGYTEVHGNWQMNLPFFVGLAVPAPLKNEDSSRL